MIAIAMLAALPAQAQDRSDCDPGEQELKFSTVTAVRGHPKGEAALDFASRINQRFNGRFCVVIYGNAELYDDNDALWEAMRAGEVTFAAPSLDKLEQFSPKIVLFSLPFLFDGPLHALEFMNSDTAQEISNDFVDDGFFAFGFWSNDMRQMIATVPIRHPRDAEGLVFRVSSSSPITDAVFGVMGIETLQLPFSKVNDALASGEVQGLENPWSNIETQRFYTYNTVVTETNHNYLGYMTMTTTAFLDSLSAEDAQFFIDTMKLVTHERNRFAFEINQLSRQNIIEDGGVIITLTPEELNEFRAAFQPIFDEYRNIIGAELVDKVIEINANARPFE
jgi:C4-dicarboxylate-binding protein DctP